MRHAYLIIAHHEFKVLEQLVFALDDCRNDIFIHFDQKVKEIPTLSTQHANLVILEKRLDVRWGSLSQIRAEYALFESAYRTKNGYARYHLISGTHLPLKSQDEIHAFFYAYQQKEILRYIYTNTYEVNMKLARYHFFVRYYQHPVNILRKLAVLGWRILLKIQYICGIQRVSPKVSIKANNWVSLTEEAVVAILQQKVEVLARFRYTFCADEYFVPYVLENQPQKFKMINEERLLFNEFEQANVRLLKQDDFKKLMESDFLFARKFGEREMEVVYNIVDRIRKGD